MLIKDLLNWLFGFIAITFLWQTCSFLVNPEFLPAPVIVLNSIYHNSTVHIINLTQTAWEAATGLLISIIISIALIFIIGAYRRFEGVIYPFILLLKSTPAVAFVPIFMLIIGTGVLTKIFIAALICFFPLIIGGIDGLKRTPEKFLILAKSYGSKSLTTFLNFEIGYTIEGFCSGLKTAAPLSVIGAIVGEYVTGGNQSGLGAFIITNSIKYVKVNLYAGAVLSSLLGIIFFLFSNLIYNLYAQKLHIRK